LFFLSEPINNLNRKTHKLENLLTFLQNIDFKELDTGQKIKGMHQIKERERKRYSYLFFIWNACFAVV